MMSSERVVLYVREPKTAPRIGSRFRPGIPLVPSLLVSEMMPPIAIVSPSCTVSCV